MFEHAWERQIQNKGAGHFANLNLSFVAENFPYFNFASYWEPVAIATIKRQVEPLRRTNHKT